MTSVFGIICWSRHFFMPNGINHPEPLSSHNILTNVSLVEHQLSKPNHTADRFVSCGTVKHFYPHWCQRNTQAAASSTTFVCEGEREGERAGERDGWTASERERETDSTAVLLNLDRKVMKLDLWLISSVTLQFHGSYDASQHVISWVEGTFQYQPPSCYFSPFPFLEANSDAITITEMFITV